MAAPLQYAWTVVQGETLDLTIDVPMDYAVEGGGSAPGPGGAETPESDGSVFEIAFKRVRGDVQTFLRFSSAYSVPNLTLGAYEEGKLSLSFSAAEDEIRQAPAGDYVGDLIHVRPRGGPFGPARSRVAIITLTIQGATA
ncbi:hypothetical protein LG047_12515 [Methylocystis sp. WRRC1]|uniref:hypothetical protein n=1 Tax=unclassified Methylocystis TaxID=2625913 RepID=UPI0001F86A9A|nr:MULTISPECIES: hypothetical protein [unclassified Methylocystis]MCC3246133.1 hypothetical protein [Methylocystis sp. WRRC1]